MVTLGSSDSLPLSSILTLALHYDGALESPDLLLSYSMVALALHITIIIILITTHLSNVTPLNHFKSPFNQLIQVREHVERDGITFEGMLTKIDVSLARSSQVICEKGLLSHEDITLIDKVLQVSP